MQARVQAVRHNLHLLPAHPAPSAGHVVAQTGAEWLTRGSPRPPTGELPALVFLVASAL